MQIEVRGKIDVQPTRERAIGGPLTVLKGDGGLTTSDYYNKN